MGAIIEISWRIFDRVRLAAPASLPSFPAVKWRWRISWSTPRAKALNHPHVQRSKFFPLLNKGELAVLYCFIFSLHLLLRTGTLDALDTLIFQRSDGNSRVLFSHTGYCSLQAASRSHADLQEHRSGAGLGEGATKQFAASW